MDYVVLGAGIAGVSAIREIIKRRKPADRITLITEEVYPFYYRPRLIECLSGQVGIEQIMIHRQDWFADNGVDLFLAERVEQIDLNQKLVITAKNQHQYERLLLATGAHCFVPPIRGVEKGNIFTLRNGQDAVSIYAQACRSRKAVVLGGGLLGLESAYNLHQAGLEVEVIESLDWLLPRQLDQAAGALLKKMLEQKGLKINLGVKTLEFNGENRVKGLLLSDGREIGTELVLLSTGVRPNTKLVEELPGISRGTGIKVNQYMETGVANVFAAGDVAEHGGICYGIWGPAALQGRVAGVNMSGDKMVFQPPLPSHKLKVANINVISLGIIDPGERYSCQIEEKEDAYKKVILAGEQAIGAIIVGNFAGLEQLLSTIKQNNLLN